MTVTDELLAEIEDAAYSSEFGVVVEAQSLREALNELCRLRAENAELSKDAGRYRWLAWISDTQPFCVYECSTGQVLFGVRADTAIDTAMASQ